MKNRLVNWLLLIFSITLIFNIIRTTANLSREDSVIKEAQDRLQKAKDENQNLQRELAGVQSQQFIEKEARNKLNMGKEGEIVILLPSISPEVIPTLPPADTSSNWQKWVKIFL